MKIRKMFLRVIAGLFIYAATQLATEAATPTIHLVTSFLVNSDPYLNTRPRGINNNGDIVGDIEFQSYDTQGFIRFRDGTYSILEHPGGKPHTTIFTGINDSNLILGYYSNAAFFLAGDTYTDFTVPDTGFTIPYGLNNAGNVTGIASFNHANHAFVIIGGDVTFFSIQGIFASVGGINNFDQVDGYFYDQVVGYHGYLREADGSVTFPIDYPGAVDTAWLGINDKGWMVGYYTDTEGFTHGLLRTSGARFATFDLPRTRSTVLTGINNRGLICGYYIYDGAGTTAGLIARVSRE